VGLPYGHDYDGCEAADVAASVSVVSVVRAVVLFCLNSAPSFSRSQPLAKTTSTSCRFSRNALPAPLMWSYSEYSTIRTTAGIDLVRLRFVSSVREYANPDGSGGASSVAPSSPYSWQRGLETHSGQSGRLLRASPKRTPLPQATITTRAPS